MVTPKQVRVCACGHISEIDTIECGSCGSLESAGYYRLVEEQQFIDLSRYEKVSKTKSLEELAELIESFANEAGDIQGKTRMFSAKKMAMYCRSFDTVPDNSLTRNWGIRQQAIYLID